MFQRLFCVADKMDMLAVEMKSAGFYYTVAYTGKSALALCSISDDLVIGEKMVTEERQNLFLVMLQLVLKTAVSFSQNC